MVREIDACKLCLERLLDRRARLREIGEQRVEHRRQEQGKHQGQAEAANNDRSDGDAAFRSGPGGKDQRYRTEDRRNHRHDDRPQLQHCRIDDSIAHARAGITQLVGELNDQNAVLGHQADQQDDADPAVDVERKTGQAQRILCRPS